MLLGGVSTTQSICCWFIPCFQFQYFSFFLFRFWLLMVVGTWCKLQGPQFLGRTRHTRRSYSYQKSMKLLETLSLFGCMVFLFLVELGSNEGFSEETKGFTLHKNDVKEKRDHQPSAESCSMSKEIHRYVLYDAQGMVRRTEEVIRRWGLTVLHGEWELWWCVRSSDITDEHICSGESLPGYGDGRNKGEEEGDRSVLWSGFTDKIPAGLLVGFGSRFTGHGGES
ncbi:hypothetical protein NE237_027716 [Protea cynaroides]|uniref:Uncharacterized protein n=1 Tax=Protea cynaroides TaxID=273540 RepID=A0A9Q0JS68_9MAGN|nr:hypothetical protein NE237_027716 [Protea cynaroides]